MIEICPGLRAGLVRHTARGAVHLALELEADGFTTTVYIDEAQMHVLRSTLNNAITAALKVRGEKDKYRKGQRFR